MSVEHGLYAEIALATATAREPASAPLVRTWRCAVLRARGELVKLRRLWRRVHSEALSVRHHHSLLMMRHVSHNMKTTKHSAVTVYQSTRSAASTVSTKRSQLSLRIIVIQQQQHYYMPPPRHRRCTGIKPFRDPSVCQSVPGQRRCIYPHGYAL